MADSLQGSHFWEFRRLPTDVLRLLAQRLEIEDIFALRCCNKEIARRFTLEPIVTSLELRRIDLPFSHIFSALAHLRELSLKLRDISLDTRLIGASWMTLLPKTLVKVDFEFREACTIWTRRCSPQDGTPPSSKTPCLRYAPMRLRESLPELQYLRLCGDWGVNFFPGGEFLLEDTVLWERPQIQYFVQNLPVGLLALVLPIYYFEEAIIPYLPPNLTKLNHDQFSHVSLAPRSSSIAPEATTMSSELYESLTEIWWPFALTYMNELLPKFRGLETLDLSYHHVPSSSFALLPPKLAHLTLDCGELRMHRPSGGTSNQSEFKLRFEDFLLLPIHLLSLHLKQLYAPSETADSPISSLAEVLPKKLTRLELSMVQSYGSAPFSFSTRLRGLNKTHPALRELCLGSYAPLVSMENLAFISPQLETFKVGFPINLRTTTSMAFPPDVTLTKLVVTGSVCASFLKMRMPTTLTHLELHEVLSPAGFLNTCPPSVRTLILCQPRPSVDTRVLGATSKKVCSRSPIDAHKLLELIDPHVPDTHHHPPPPMRFPHLVRLIAPIFYDNPPMEPGETELSLQKVHKMSRFIRNGLFRSAFPNFEHPFPSLPPHVTSIELPIVVAEFSPIWQLQGLRSLKVLSVFVEPAAKSVVPVMPHLTQIHTTRPSTNWVECFESKAFENVTDLAINLPTKVTPTAPFSSISRLTSLKTLSLKCEHADYSRWHGIMAHLPESITSLETSNAPEWFWPSHAGQAILPESMVPAVSLFESAVLSATSTIMSIFSKKDNSGKASSGAVPRVPLCAPKLCLSRLELHGVGSLELALLCDYQLASLAPHLTHLGTSAITVTDRLGLIEGLQDDLTEISDLDLVRSICPSIQTLRVLGSKKSNNTIKWTYNNFPSGPECYMALPNNLRKLDGNFLIFVPSMNDLLPKSLTYLDISSSSIAPETQEIRPFPPTLVTLHLSLCTNSIFPLAFSASLPRGLTTLKVSKLGHLSKVAVNALPPQLTTFSAPELLLGSAFECLPSTLTSLTIGRLKRKVLSYEKWKHNDIIDVYCVRGVHDTPFIKN